MPTRAHGGYSKLGKTGRYGRREMRGRCVRVRGRAHGRAHGRIGSLWAACMRFLGVAPDALP